VSAPPHENMTLLSLHRPAHCAGDRSPGRVTRVLAASGALLRHRSALVGLVLVLLTVLLALGSLAVPEAAFYEQSLHQRLMPPSALHWFGTDELGRDLLLRVMAGARVTLMIVLLVALVAGPVGLVAGAAAGYAGGWVDMVLMRLTDIVLSLPRLVLALALVAALGPGIVNAVVAIALTAWPPYARVARAEALSLRSADFILAARLQGASEARIVLRYVVPLCVSSVLVRMTLDMAGVILTAAGLGFLGLGAQPPLAEWGAMVAAGRPHLVDHWWVSTVPGLAIFAVSLGFNLLGEGMRDLLDPRQT
jgi:peptide/nickel transport system permease protein